MLLRCAIVGFLLAMSCHSLQGQTPKATSVRDTDAVCASCHGEIYKRYLSTPMANASGDAAANFHSTTFLHKPSGVTYSLAEVSGEPELSLRRPGESGVGNQVRLDYFLGSGHLGVTYLYSKNGYLFESPVAWFSRSNSYDMKPGLEDLKLLPPALPMESKCLRCHMSAVQPNDAGSVNRYKDLPFLHTGITCEACHGDSHQHVLAKGKAPVVNPAKLDAARRDSVCISCHLEGDVSVERAGRTALDYQPGDSITQFLAYYVKSGANLTKRGVSEVEQLSQSTCKRMSGDKMSCTTCHDPHGSPAAAERAAYYRQRCLSCHSQPAFAAKHHPENADCTSCHMPRTAAENILHVAWTDHRILRIPQASDPTASVQSSVRLEPIYPADSTPRDLAMAHYQALMEGDRTFEGIAWNELRQLEPSIQHDREALDALGNLAAERADLATAQRSFETVLKLDPTDATALSNLGVILARQGKLEDAARLLGEAFDRNQDLPGLAVNLARIECAEGDGEAAKRTLQTVVDYNPGQGRLQQLETEMANCGQQKTR